MMQAIHNHTKGIISKIILSLVVITFVLWGVQGFIMSRALDTAVATVNGTEIEAHQFQNRLQQAMNQMTTRYDASLLDQPMFKENIKRQLLQEMINEELLKQASNYLGLKIGDEQLRKAIEHIPAFQQDGKFSEELFSQYLARDNGRELYANLENELIERQLRSAFSMGSFVLDNEIDKAIQLYKEKRDFSYVQISAEKQTPKALPSQQALKDFYTRQKERYAISEKVSLAYLELDVEALKKNIKVDWKDIETRYNENIAQYKTAKRWHLAHLVVDSQDEKGKALAKKIQSEINKGADFRKLAKKHSMDLITSQEGGDLGLLTERMLTREMKLALKKLKPGQVSTPYVDKHGTVFLKLIEIKEPKLTPLKLVQEKIRNEIKSERVGKQYSDMAEQLANLTFSNPDTLEEASKTLNLPIKTTPLFTKDKGADAITNNDLVRRAAFSQDVLEADNNSDLIQVDASRSIVVRVAKHIDKSYVPFEKVAAAIKKEIIVAEKRQQAKALAKSLLEKIEKGESITAELKKSKLSLLQAKDVDRGNSKYNKALLQQAFEIGADKFHIVDVPNGDRYLVKVSGIKPGSLKVVKASERTQLVKALESRNGLDAYRLYENFLREKAKIKINFNNLAKVH